jgi:CRP/FNR family transcriptional regulator, cyclic AMP receptor protein
MITTKTNRAGVSAKRDEPAEDGKAPGPERKISMARGLSGIIARQPFFKGLTSRQIELLADSAMEEEFDKGETITQEGDPANRFYLILEGKVLVESETREHGRIPVQTLGPGDDLGWSWLFPPYYMRFSARAMEPTKAIFFYGTRLRHKCDEDPVLGYEVMKRVANAMLKCLNAARQELLKRTPQKG